MIRQHNQRIKLRVLPVATRIWGEHMAAWTPCVRCDIGRIARRHVFARGVVPCHVLFIGEGPGVSEDLVGYPFIGRSGRLLDEWINTSLGNQDQMAYAVTNIIACRATDRRGGENRAPHEEEVENCSRRLRDFVLGIAAPRIVVLLGKPAARAWSKADWAQKSKLPTLTLWHPAAVLRVGGSGSTKDLEQRIRLREFLRSVYNEA